MILDDKEIGMERGERDKSVIINDLASTSFLISNLISNLISIRNHISILSISTVFIPIPNTKVTLQLETLNVSFSEQKILLGT